MVFKSKSGIERNKKVQIVLAAILISLISWFVIAKGSDIPSSQSTDGIYRNSCCNDIIIRNGSIYYGNKVALIKIENMKFGVTGYIDRVFNSTEMQKSNELTAISFSNVDGRKSLSLPIGGRDSTFKMTDIKHHDGVPVTGVPGVPVTGSSGDSAFN